MNKKLSKRALADPSRDAAILAAGRVSLRLATGKDLDLDADVWLESSARTQIIKADDDRVSTKEETLERYKHVGRAVAKEEKEDDNMLPPSNQNNQNQQGIVGLAQYQQHSTVYTNTLSPVVIREQHVAKARRIFGVKSGAQQYTRDDPADNDVAEHRKGRNAIKVLQQLHSQHRSAVCKAFQRLYVKWYRRKIERLHSSLSWRRGIPGSEDGLVPLVVRACQRYRPWRRPGQLIKFMYGVALAFQEETQTDLLLDRSQLNPGLGGDKGIVVVCLIHKCNQIVSMVGLEHKPKDLIDVIKMK